MFDSIQRNNNLTHDWAILLLQLVSHGVVDMHNNPDLCTVILDMLDALVHGTLASDNPEKGEENKKVVMVVLLRQKDLKKVF